MAGSDLLDDVDVGRVWQRQQAGRPALELDFNIDGGSYRPEGLVHTIASLAPMWLEPGVEGANLIAAWSNDFADATYWDIDLTEISITPAYGTAPNGAASTKLEAIDNVGASLQLKLAGRPDAVSMPGDVIYRLFVRPVGDDPFSMDRFLLRNNTTFKNLVGIDMAAAWDGTFGYYEGAAGAKVTVYDDNWLLLELTSDLFSNGDDIMVYVGSSGGVVTIGHAIEVSTATVTIKKGQHLGFAPHNLIIESEDFDAATWLKPGTATVASGHPDPKGGNNAWLVSGIGTVNAHDLYDSVGMGTETYADQPLYGGFWFKRVTTSGTMEIRNPPASASGQWTLDFGKLTDEWAFITADHDAITVTNAFKVNGTAGGFRWCDPEDKKVSFYLYKPQLNAGRAITPYMESLTDQELGPAFELNTQTAKRGLVIQDDRNNIFTHSDELDHADWLSNNVTVTPNAGTAPDGSDTAYELDDGTDAAITHRIYQTVTMAAGAATITFFAKDIDRGWCNIRIKDSGGTYRNGFFDIAGAAVGPMATGLSGTITARPGGWYECTATIADAFVTAEEVFIGLSEDGTTNTYTGSNKKMLFWRGCLSDGGAIGPASVPPTGADVETRAVDDCTLALSTALANALEVEGTIIVEFSIPALGFAATRWVANINNGTDSNDRIALYIDSSDQGRGQVRVGGVTLGTPSMGAISANTVHRLAMSWDATDCIGVMDGGASSTKVTGPLMTNLAELGLGQDHSAGADNLGGTICRADLFTHKMTAAEMQTRTAG